MQCYQNYLIRRRREIALILPTQSQYGIIDVYVPTLNLVDSLTNHITNSIMDPKNFRNVVLFSFWIFMEQSLETISPKIGNNSEPGNSDILILFKHHLGHSLTNHITDSIMDPKNFRSRETTFPCLQECCFISIFEIPYKLFINHFTKDWKQFGTRKHRYIDTFHTTIRTFFDKPYYRFYYGSGELQECCFVLVLDFHGIVFGNHFT